MAAIMHGKTVGRRSGSARDDKRGFSLIELLVVILVILIIAAIAIPNFLRSKIAVNESSAVQSLRTISTAAITYNASWGNGYPPSLAVLGGPGPAACDAANLLDPILGAVPYTKSGYAFNLAGEQGNVPSPSCATPGFNAYFATAVPVSPLTGVRSFCVDQAGEIHFDVAGGAAASGPACDALPVL